MTSGLIKILLQIDRIAFCAVNQVDSAAWNHIFGYGTYLGQGLVLTVILFFALLLFDRKRFPKNFVIVGLAMALAGTINAGIKEIVERPRPLADEHFNVDADTMRETRLAGGMRVSYYLCDDPAAPYMSGALKVIGKRYKRHSFPSGHTAAAFAFAVGLIYISRRKIAWLLLIPAVFVGVSRIACGVHFPLDVLFGASVGTVTSWGFLRFFEIFHGLSSFPKSAIYAKPPDAKPKIMMVAGEASADIYGARVIEQLKKLNPEIEAYGVGGQQLEKSGLRLLADANELSIVGFTAVITALSVIVKIFFRLVHSFREETPDALVCIDLPDFNLMLATQARRCSIPVLYYISPQIWAWRRGRVRAMADKVSKMIVAFPFEKMFYEKAGIPVAFHGHPLLEDFQMHFDSMQEAKEHFGLDPLKKTLVIAPGSRRNEFKYNLADMFAAGKLILDELPDWQVAVPLAQKADENEMDNAAFTAGIKPIFTRGDNIDLFACADFGVICSGTATLEAALAGLPMVIVYRGHPLNIWLARRLVSIDRVGLPNIILGGDEMAFPELIQKDARAKPCAEKVLAILRDAGEYAKLVKACERVKNSLQGGDTSGRVAREIVDLMSKKI